VVGIVRELDIVALTTFNLLQAVKIQCVRFLDWSVSYTDVVAILLTFKDLISFDATRVWEASRNYTSVSNAVLGRDMVVFVFDITVKVNYASSVIDNSFADTWFWSFAHTFATWFAATVTAAVTLAVLADISIGTYRSANI
jgi:hypothetical protein